MPLCSHTISLNGVVWLHAVVRKPGKLLSFVSRHPCAVLILGEFITENEEGREREGGREREREH